MLRVLFPYLAFYKRHKWMLTLGVVLAIITLVSSVGMLALSGWFLAASALSGSLGLYSFNYMLPSAGMRVTAIIRTAGRYFERLVSHDATFRVLQHLRIFIFSRLIHLSPSGLAQFRQGELLNRVVADVNTLDHLYLRVISPMIGALVMIIVVTFGLSILNLTLALTLGCVMLLTLFLLPILFYRTGKLVGINLTRLRSMYRQELTIWLQSQLELALFGASQRYRAQMDNTELNWLKAQSRQSELSALSQATMTLIVGITVISILWIASSGANDNPQSGSLIALFVFCTLAAFEALMPATSAFQHLGQVTTAAMYITQLIEKPQEVQFTEKYSHVPSHVALRFENVTFTYDGQLQPALNDFTLDICAGKHVAILGRTGCGKSTLLQLITRAWDLCRGLISINEIPITNFNALALRCTMSIVPQRVHLFSATLRDNLQLANPDVNDASLSAVLNRVGLQKLLESEGLNSWMGEGGRQLSGGELRRLALARALLHDGPLILLDEPTEGLDPITELQILDLLKQVMKGKTALMVTHRLHGLENFDQIIVMENGQIIEQGNHTELLTKRGRYYRLKQRL